MHWCYILSLLTKFFFQKLWQILLASIMISPPAAEAWDLRSHNVSGYCDTSSSKKCNQCEKDFKSDKNQVIQLIWLIWLICFITQYVEMTGETPQIASLKKQPVWFSQSGGLVSHPSSATSRSAAQASKSWASQQQLHRPSLCSTERVPPAPSLPSRSQALHTTCLQQTSKMQPRLLPA